MADYGASIRQLPPTALDPDQLEQTYAAGIARQVPAGYQMPFLFGAMLDRQRRGQQLADANVRGNQQAYDLAQQAMATDERGQLRTMYGTLAGHGMPTDPNLLMVGGMPTPQSANAVAGAGNPLMMQESQGRAAQAFGAGARSALEGGVSPNALPGMSGMARETPLRVQTAGISAAGHNRERFVARTDAQGNTTYEANTQSPERTVELGQQMNSLVQQRNQAQQAQQMISQHPPLRDAVTRARAATEADGGRVVGMTSDANTVTIHAERNGQRVSRTFGRDGRPVATQ